jgi:hypothetical protein
MADGEAVMAAAMHTMTDIAMAVAMDDAMDAVIGRRA